MRYEVNDVTIKLTEDETLVAGEVKVHYAEFTFDSSWDEYTKLAVFKRGVLTMEQKLTDNKCEIPWEVLTKRGTLMVGIYGTTAEKTRPTLWAPGKTINDGAEPGEASREPTPDKWQQILEQQQQAVGEKVEGRFFAPYTVDEEDDCAYIWEDELEAQFGAEIFNDYDGNIAAGYMSTAAGYETQAIGNYSITSGWWTRADGQCAHAEGLLTRASGHFTHAEGTRTKATVNNAHSEGDLTTASGRQSHAEGTQTTASGQNSHAEGYMTVASGQNSHSEGQSTVAAGKNQTAMGKFNVKDTSNLLIVGRGTSDTDRKNAHTLDASGNAWYAGDVYVGSTGGKNKDVLPV